MTIRNDDVSALRTRLRHRVGWCRHPVVVVLLAMAAPIGLVKLWAGDTLPLLVGLPGGQTLVTWCICVTTWVLLVSSLWGGHRVIATVWAQLLGWLVLASTLANGAITGIANAEHWYSNPFYVLVGAIAVGGYLWVLLLIPVIMSWYPRGIALLLTWIGWLRR